MGMGIGVLHSGSDADIAADPLQQRTDVRRKAARRAGWQINDQRIRRLWREEGSKVPKRSRKKRLTGIGAHV